MNAQLGEKTFSRSIDWSGKELTLETGKLARQADGAVLARMGETVVLTTVVFSKEKAESQGFLPLSVHYREMFSASGKIPGGFMKREGKPSDGEVLVSRLIDRSIRPLFAKDFSYEIQVISTVLSYDPSADPSVLAIIGASAAIAISGLPVSQIIGAVKLGMKGEAVLVNPTSSELKDSRLDLVISGFDNSVVMLESASKELSEEAVAGAVETGMKALNPVIELISEMKKSVGKATFAFDYLASNDSHVESIVSSYGSSIVEGLHLSVKSERVAYFTSLKAKVIKALEASHSLEDIKRAFSSAINRVMRNMIVTEGKRIGGRASDAIRNISCEAGMLPRAHGSAVFTRGDTQALATVTLGTSEDEQVVDSMSGDLRESFLLQYSFPPYSVGECGAFRSPGRREVGHGRLALKAIIGVMPKKSDFPYTVRVVSEVTESDGSSSQATVCAAVLSLMDAGVPIREMVAGIAMGLIKDKNKNVILSDISGDEDNFGDIDLKVAGTKKGVTALQMDSAILGIDLHTIKEVLSQAKEGRMHILSEMAKVLSAPREKLSSYAPLMTTITIKKEEIRDLIGPGGRSIKDICEKTKSKINVSDDGVVQISSPSKESMQLALESIRSVTGEGVKVGVVFSGKIVKIIDSGVFVNFSGPKDGFVHISEIADERISSIYDYVSEGDVSKFVVIGVDKGRVRLSMKAVNEDGTVSNIDRPDRRKDEGSSSAPSGFGGGGSRFSKGGDSESRFGSRPPRADGDSKFGGGRPRFGGSDDRSSAPRRNFRSDDRNGGGNNRNRGG
jgi:polyribonucleotide nucleotidyltransferase